MCVCVCVGGKRGRGGEGVKLNELGNRKPENSILLAQANHATDLLMAQKLSS